MRFPRNRTTRSPSSSSCPNEQIDPILFERSYYLQATGKSPKAYVLLLRTLERTDRTAIVQFALRQKTRLAALRVRERRARWSRPCSGPTRCATPSSPSPVPAFASPRRSLNCPPRS